MHFQPPVYVVSVKTFTDRHQHLKAQAKLHGLELTFIWDFDVEELTSQAMAKVSPNSMPPPAMSCVLKHLDAQRRLLESSHSMALVLEDDALLFDDFSRKLREVVDLANQINGPWLIFLGGSDNALDIRFFESTGLSLIEAPVTTTEAYLINRAGCELRMSWLTRNRIDKPADHLLKQLDTQLGITQYRVSRPCVAQGSITGKFVTSLDGSRARKPNWYLKMRYFWNRWRNQTLPRVLVRMSLPGLVKSVKK